MPEPTAFPRMVVRALLKRAPSCRNFAEFMEHPNMADTLAFELDSKTAVGRPRNWFTPLHIVVALWEAEQKGIWREELES
jgi:hypothetical protein